MIKRSRGMFLAFDAISLNLENRANLSITFKENDFTIKESCHMYVEILIPLSKFDTITSDTTTCNVVTNISN